MSYGIKLEAEVEFDAEIQQWMSEGVLLPSLPWDEKLHEPVRHYIPLMVVIQRKGEYKTCSRLPGIEHC